MVRTGSRSLSDRSFSYGHPCRFLVVSIALGFWFIPEIPVPQIPAVSYLSQYLLPPISPNLIAPVPIPTSCSSPLLPSTGNVHYISPSHWDSYIHLLSPSCFRFLGLCFVAWLSFTLWLISTYEWVYTMFIFVGLSYHIQE